MIRLRTKLAGVLGVLCFAIGEAWLAIKDWLVQREWPGWHIDYEAPLGGRVFVLLSFAFVLLFIIFMAVDLISRKRRVAPG